MFLANVGETCSVRVGSAAGEGGGQLRKLLLVITEKGLFFIFSLKFLSGYCGTYRFFRWVEPALSLALV